MNNIYWPLVRLLFALWSVSTSAGSCAVSLFLSDKIMFVHQFCAPQSRYWMGTQLQVTAMALLGILYNFFAMPTTYCRPQRRPVWHVWILAFGISRFPLAKVTKLFAATVTLFIFRTSNHINFCSDINYEWRPEYNNWWNWIRRAYFDCFSLLRPFRRRDDRVQLRCNQLEQSDSMRICSRSSLHKYHP